MSITIPGVPEFLTREQYIGMFAAVGFDPSDVLECRFAPDGVHALVVHRNPETGARVLDLTRKDAGYLKHRVYIPVRDGDDKRVARISPVQ